MKYFTIVCLLLGITIFLIPPYRATYDKPTQENIKKVAVKSQVKTVKRVYKEPQGEAKEIIEYVSRETGYSIEQISKIVWAESDYSATAKHINTNGTYDSGYFQINSQHITLAKSMGINIFTPKGNADFAIHLIRKNGLRDWSASQKNWAMI